MTTKNFLLLLIIVCVFTAMLIGGAPQAVAQTITLAFTSEPDTDPAMKYQQLVLTEAFRRLGLTFAYRVYPIKRAGMTANSGEVDGEPGRNANYTAAFPNLVRVEAPVLIVKVAAFATNPTIRLTAWDSLQGTAYKVEYLIGTIVTENHLAALLPPEQISEVATIAQALKKLAAGRTDIFVHVESQVVEALRAPEFQQSGILQVGVLEEIPLYPYLHNTHAALAPKLAEVMRQMKAEGLFEQYQAEAATLTQK